MVNGKLAYAAPPAQNASQAGNAFERVFMEVDRRNQRSEPATQSSSRTRDDESRQNRARENRREDRVSRRQENFVSDDAANTSNVATVQEAVTQVAYAAECATIDEVKIVEEVAEIMEVPVEEVTQWLYELELDPQDLTDTKAVTKMLCYALDAETPAELLTNEEFPALYKAINEGVEELLTEAKATAVVNTDAYATEKSESKADILVDTAYALENIDADEKLLYMENDAKGDSSAYSHQQSSTNTATAQNTAQVATATYEAAVNELNLDAADATLMKADDKPTDNSQTANPAMNLETAVAKATQAIQQSSVGQPVNATDIIEQIMGQMKLTNSGGNFTEIRIALRPESLGDIVLRVITQNGIVMAQFEAENQRVKEALEANFNQLRDALEEQGIAFSELSVFVRQDENERAGQFERARQASRHRAESIEEATPAIQEEISYHNGMIDVTA